MAATGCRSPARAWPCIPKAGNHTTIPNKGALHVNEAYHRRGQHCWQTSTQPTPRATSGYICTCMNICRAGHTMQGRGGHSGLQNEGGGGQSGEAEGVCIHETCQLAQSEACPAASQAQLAPLTPYQHPYEVGQQSASSCHGGTGVIDCTLHCSEVTTISISKCIWIKELHHCTVQGWQPPLPSPASHTCTW